MIAFTIEMALLATALLLVPGTLIAWLLARRAWRGKALVETFVMLPLVLPPVATGLILLRLFGRRGAIGSHLPFNIIFTWRAVVLAMTVMAFPLFVRTARVAFEHVNRRYEDIARTLGAHEPRVFFTITLPLAARGIVAGAVIAFARALGEFGATILVAGNISGKTSTIATSIYTFVQLGEDGPAMALLGVSVAIAFAAIFASELLVRKA